MGLLQKITHIINGEEKPFLKLNAQKDQIEVEWHGRIWRVLHKIENFVLPFRTEFYNLSSIFDLASSNSPSVSLVKLLRGDKSKIVKFFRETIPTSQNFILSVLNSAGGRTDRNKSLQVLLGIPQSKLNEVLSAVPAELINASLVKAFFEYRSVDDRKKFVSQLQNCCGDYRGEFRSINEHICEFPLDKRNHILNICEFTLKDTVQLAYHTSRLIIQIEKFPVNEGSKDLFEECQILWKYFDDASKRTFVLGHLSTMPHVERKGFGQNFAILADICKETTLRHVLFKKLIEIDFDKREKVVKIAAELFNYYDFEKSDKNTSYLCDLIDNINKHFKRIDLFIPVIQQAFLIKNKTPDFYSKIFEILNMISDDQLKNLGQDICLFVEKDDGIETRKDVLEFFGKNLSTKRRMIIQEALIFTKSLAERGVNCTLANKKYLFDLIFRSPQDCIEGVADKILKLLGKDITLDNIEYLFLMIGDYPPKETKNMLDAAVESFRARDDIFGREFIMQKYQKLNPENRIFFVKLLKVLHGYSSDVVINIFNEFSQEWIIKFINNSELANSGHLNSLSSEDKKNLLKQFTAKHKDESTLQRKTFILGLIDKLGITDFSLV